MYDRSYPSKFSVARNPSRTAAEKPAILPLLLITLYMLGVPIFFVVNDLLRLGMDYNLSIWIMVLVVLIAAITIFKVPTTQAHRAYFRYFAALIFTTLLAFLGLNKYIGNGQIALLFVYTAYASPFVGMYYLVRSRAHYQYAMRLLDLLALAIPITVFLSYIAPTYLGFSFGEVVLTPLVRAFGPIGDQVGFVLIYFLFRSLLRRNRALALLNGAAIFITATRGAWIAGALGIVWMISNRKLTRRQQLASAFIFVVISLGGLTFLSSEGGDPTSYVGARLTSESSYSQRFAAFNLGLQVVESSPIFGVGYMGFTLVRQDFNYIQYFDTVDGAQRGTANTQNQYIQTATDAGIVGLLTLIFFLLSLYRSLQQSIKHNQGEFQLHARAYSAWLVALALGNLGALWLVPYNMTTYLFFVVGGLEMSLYQGNFGMTVNAHE